MDIFDKYDFDYLRNYYLTQGDYGGACFLQALLMKALELKGGRLRTGKAMRQEYDILDDLVNTIIPGSDGNMADLILAIAGLALAEAASKQYQKFCRKVSKLFPAEWERQADLVLEILLKNAITIKTACDEDFLVQYIDNILSATKEIYGYESRVYAQIYLHFLCECSYEDILEYKDELIEKYEYFKKYLEGYDIFYVSCLFSCMPIFMEQDKKEYEYWLGEFKTAVKANKSAAGYPVLVCQFGYIKALEYEKGNDSRAVVNVLSKVINTYIFPKTIQNNISHVHILLKAAAHCNAVNEYGAMVKYARKGVSICEELGADKTELYYEIYNYIGINMIYDGKYTEAQEFYGKNCKNIERKFGRNCENYLNYINNLGLVYLSQGRINDATACFDEGIKVEGEAFEEIKRNLIFRNLNYIRNLFSDDQAVIDKYVKRYLSTSSLKAGSNTGLKIQWLAEKLGGEEVDFAEIDMPFSEIYTLYKRHEVPEHFKTSFEYCIIMYQWRKGKSHAALGLSCKVADRIGNQMFSYNHNGLAVNHLKLLMKDKEYMSAQDFCEKLIDYRYGEIIAKGMRDITSEVASLRMVMSYYINLVDKYLCDLYKDRRFCSQLIERIVNCKTVEKDIRSIIGKYDSEQKDISFKLYEFRDLRRKINALELRKNIMESGDSDESEIHISVLEHEIFRYATKLAELEVWLAERIDLREFVRGFKYQEISLPVQSAALEFFGYLELDFDAGEPDYDNLEVKYLCLAVTSAGNEVFVSYAGKYNDNEYMLQEYFDCFFNGIETDTLKLEKIKNSFANVVFPVIAPYIKGCSTIYWGLDAELHLIPIEWMLGDKYGDAVNIHMDSVKYIRNDERLEFSNASSLIMGNPEYAIGKDIPKDYQELLCSEIECREIAKIAGGKALLGKEANQSEFNRNFDSDILHIATHGEVDYIEDVFFEKNKLKHVRIMLSGYCDWCADKKADGYGNGIITADDITYTNMKNTKLAVIAACLSGFSSVNLLLGNVYSIRWALGIAGVHFSVTALWKTDDAATSIFMVLFYRNLQKMCIGKAFHMAKEKLRTITREEIKCDIVLRKLFEQYDDTSGYGEAYPFQEEQYWAAFTCYCS